MNNLTIKRLTEEERRAVRNECSTDSIFRMMYLPLWRQRSDDLQPEEVWKEACWVVKRIGDTETDVREFEVLSLFDDLAKRYEVLSPDVVRTADDVSHSVMMVMLAVFFMLLDVKSDLDNHPHLEICQLLKKQICTVRNYSTLYEDCRKEEDKREAKGDFIPVIDYIEHLASASIERGENVQETLPPQAVGMLSEFVDEVMKGDAASMKEAELILSRINDKNFHQLESLLNRLRKCRDEKTKAEALPRVIGQMICTQNNLGANGIESLPDINELKKFLM